MEERGKIFMPKFKCLECKKEFELNKTDDKRCPECNSKWLQVLAGEISRGKSWSAKSFAVR